MDPIDYRNTTFAELKEKLTSLRALTYAAWIQHGPCTTEELAARSGLNLLTLRPRTTELYQMGFVELASDIPQSANPHSAIQTPKSSGGIYRARSELEAQIVFVRRQRTAAKTQLDLGI